METKLRSYKKGIAVLNEPPYVVPPPVRAFLMISVLTNPGLETITLILSLAISALKQLWVEFPMTVRVLYKNLP